MSQLAKQGDMVQVHYTGRLNDGTVFDSSEQRDPLQFELGARQMIPGFEKAVFGMAVGDKKTVEIPAGEAYGESSPEMIIHFPRTEVPQDMSPFPGMELMLTTQQGQQVPAKVIEVTDEEIVLDANHPLAGKDLIFDITLVQIS